MAKICKIFSLIFITYIILGVTYFAGYEDCFNVKDICDKIAKAR
jgi:hypothetical protein